MNRPNQQLVATLRSYPELSKLVDTFRQSRGKDLPKWKSFCFLPIAAWYSIVSNTKNNGMPLFDYDLIQEMQLLSAVGTWRYSQGIYRFDEDIYQSVIDSEIKGDLPSDVLHRLPEWCLYVETPNLKAFGLDVYGFYVHLEHDMNDGRTELRILVDGDKGNICIPLHLGNWSIEEAVSRYFAEAKNQSLSREIDFQSDKKTEDEVASNVMPFVCLCLFICSDEPDISDIDYPGIKPSRPKPKKVKKGWRLFPAQKAKIWIVGKNFGNLIRKQVSDFQSKTGKTVKPHLRRGHYHTYWTGKRDSDEQKAVVKWIMPTIVGAADENIEKKR